MMFDDVDEHMDRVTLAAIYQALPEDVFLMVAEKDSIKLAWETLKTMHVGVERVKDAKVQTLKTQFEAIHMKNGESVDDFAMKLTSIVTGILSLGEKIVTTIEQFRELKNMNVEEIVGRLKVHEERLRGYGDQHEEHLLLTHDEWMSRMKKNGEANFSSGSSSCSGNGGDNRGRVKGQGQRRSCEESSTENTKPSKENSKVKCYTRQKYGNYASKCPNNRSDDEANLTSFYDEEPSLMFAEVVTKALPEDNDANLTRFYYEEPVLMFVEGDEKTNLEEFMQEPSKEELDVVLFNEEKVMEKLLACGDECNHTNVWYLNNGASNHMMGHRENLNELDEKITGNVKFEDGSKAHNFPNPACGKIYVSRDAIFEEEKKWKWCNNNNKLV
ncbi:uncharacterized protein LOC124943870 [Impatiens glandulifera]|uniref:uncharacterized protein LOC124943870 n=1 Tax=Impatiens glandulifera TaxID=253017 RepID=UPI001FB0B014|nr:uncharacterized protein LOC124943870 [Impatiens glandulifera]